MDGLLAPVLVRTRNALDDCVHGVHGSIEFVNDGFAFRGQCDPVSLGLEDVSNVRWSHVARLHGVVVKGGLKCHPVFSVDSTKPFDPDTRVRAARSKGPEDGDVQWTPVAILQCKRRNKRHMWLVKWEGVKGLIPTIPLHQTRLGNLWTVSSRPKERLNF